MINRQIESFFSRLPFLQKAGKQLATLVHQAVLDQGEEARDLADLLHGTWLGHPLHPVLTDIVVGAWSLGALFDLAAAITRSPATEKTADSLTAVGTVAAVPTALSGLADYSTVPNPAADVGLAHALLNDAALTLYLVSLNKRRQGERTRGVLYSTAGLAVLTAGAYLGGHLVYKKKVGVDHSEPVSEPTSWTPVMNEQDLIHHEPTRVDVEGHPVLLYRHDGIVHAVGAVCPHAGAPLEEGQFDGTRVQCPWHDSVFDLTDGCVVHGPATFPVANYEGRIRDGRVEVRLAGSRENGHAH
jgi:nitrite reductase/ring-hydroxylating ferredoxin subunit/uncharacterized membrane protein